MAKKHGEKHGKKLDGKQKKGCVGKLQKNNVQFEIEFILYSNF